MNVIKARRLVAEDEISRADQAVTDLGDIQNLQTQRNEWQGKINDNKKMLSDLKVFALSILERVLVADKPRRRRKER